MASGEGLAVDGKVMWIRVGSQIYRVSTDMAIMSDTEFDQTGELVDETEEAQEEVRPRRSRKVKFGIIEVAENSGDNGTDGQPEPEPGTGGDLNLRTLPDKIMAMVRPHLVRKGLFLR